VTLLDFARPFVGKVAERPGSQQNPFILWCHEFTSLKATDDETPWCSAWLNMLCALLGRPRSDSAAAISWGVIGAPRPLSEALPGDDICVFKRTGGHHVAIFLRYNGARITVIGGNQSNNVTVADFPRADLLHVRRLL